MDTDSLEDERTGAGRYYKQVTPSRVSERLNKAEADPDKSDI